MDKNIVTRDPDILGGTPVFTGTRVPVAILFENLADGLTLDEILDSYPTLPREQGLRLMILYQATCSVFENKDEALAWFKEPSGALGERIPLELLGTPEGERLVIDELMQMEHGHPV